MKPAHRILDALTAAACCVLIGVTAVCVQEAIHSLRILFTP